MLVLDCSVVAAWFLKEETLSAQLRETMCAEIGIDVAPRP